jgi:hypothetical protein
MLEGASQEERAGWLKEIEIVEWARNRTRKGSNVLYEHDPEAPNLFAVLNIASFVEDRKVFLRCS